jgi:hypothetical protein
VSKMRTRGDFYLKIAVSQSSRVTLEVITCLPA